MAKVGEIYKCNACGNVVEVKQGGDGDLVCCGQNMVQLTGEDAEPFLTPPTMKPGGP